jgi:hypothetical protein
MSPLNSRGLPHASLVPRAASVPRHDAASPQGKRSFRVRLLPGTSPGAAVEAIADALSDLLLADLTNYPEPTRQPDGVVTMAPASTRHTRRRRTPGGSPNARQ